MLCNLRSLCCPSGHALALTVRSFVHTPFVKMLYHLSGHGGLPALFPPDRTAEDLQKNEVHNI